MTDRHYSTKEKQHKPAVEYPEVVEMLADFAALSQKYTVPEIARRIGISKQALQKHINKRKGGVK